MSGEEIDKERVAQLADDIWTNFNEAAEYLAFHPKETSSEVLDERLAQRAALGAIKRIIKEDTLPFGPDNEISLAFVEAARIGDEAILEDPIPPRYPNGHTSSEMEVTDEIFKLIQVDTLDDEYDFAPSYFLMQEMEHLLKDYAAQDHGPVAKRLKRVDRVWSNLSYMEDKNTGRA